MEQLLGAVLGAVAGKVVELLIGQPPPPPSPPPPPPASSKAPAFVVGGAVGAAIWANRGKIADAVSRVRRRPGDGGDQQSG